MRRIILAVVLATSLVWSAAAAAKECKPVSGTFEATIVACPAPFCTAGSLTGGLTASYSFVMTSATQEGPILNFTGASTISQTFGDAELYSADTGWINFANGTFQTTVNIVGGTKQYEGAAGQLVATGNLTATGTAGTYTGEICKHAD
jgi:hypothetical protein